MSGRHGQVSAAPVGSPAAALMLLPGRRVYLGYDRLPGTVTRTVRDNPSDPRRIRHVVARYDVLLDDGYHATGCPAIDVAPQNYPPDLLSQDVTAAESLARWIARSRGQLTDFEGGGTHRAVIWQAALAALHEIDLARWGREQQRCPFTWPSSEGQAIGCAFFAEPGRGLCGVHMLLPDYVRQDSTHYQPRETATAVADPIGEHSPQRTVRV